MADLSLTFKELYTRTGRYVGSLNPTTGVFQGNGLQDCKDLVNRAYRRFLYPVVQVGQNMRLWEWSFLHKSAQFNVTNGVTTYNMPLDYGSMDIPFTYTLQDNKLVMALAQIDEGSMLRMQAFNAGNGEPLYFCVRPKNPDASQIFHHEVLFYPIPNGTYSFAYAYKLNPPKLENDTDIPIGAIEVAECLMQMCLAAAELQEDEVAGVQEQKATQLLMAAVQADKERNASATVGANGDSTDNLLTRLPFNWRTGDPFVKGFHVYGP